MTDLRQRLEREVAPDGCTWCEAGVERALAVFAAWLRERAEAPGMQYRAEAELRRLADEIDPKGEAA